MAGRRRDGIPSPMLVSDLERARIEWERRPVPISLPDATVKATGRKHEGQREPVSVKVPHVVNYTTDIELPGVVVAWTPKAVLVEIDHGHGRTSQLWVWAGAVERVASSSEGY